jgi:hypothetical protein
LEFVAAFFNREQAANAITSGISARYNRTAELVRTHPPSVSTTEVEPPLVAWLSIYSGTVTIGTTSLREDYTAVAGGKLFVPTVKTYSNLTAFRESQSPFLFFLFDKGAQPAPRRTSSVSLRVGRHAQPVFCAVLSYSLFFSAQCCLRATSP